MKVITEYRRPVCTHAIAFCCNCNFVWDVFHKGRSEVFKHIRKHGHKVNIETAYNQYYLTNPRSKEE